jgi:site-specific DNA recombinase
MASMARHGKKRFIALARVSSREQEREGFSLDVQVDALGLYASRQGGEIVKLWRIAVTASKKDERKTFKDLVAYAKQHAADLDGILFYKIDRAARNLFDYVELERIESEYNVPFFSVTQPTENTPAGRMQRRMLASMASFYTEQQSLDVREGVKRRVESGLFPQKAPFGYRNVRVDKRGLVEVDPVNSLKVRRIFELYAYHHLTLDSMVQRLADEGITYTASCPRFGRSKVYAILKDRAYLGEVKYQGQWHPGVHPPLVDRATWDRVQTLLGDKVYRSHELTYAGELIRCNHCGRPITGEAVTKKSTGKQYVYYRCSQYNSPGHPRRRVSEHDLDRQLLAIFDRMRIGDDDVRRFFEDELRKRTKEEQQESRGRRAELLAQVSQVEQQKDELVNLRLNHEIDADTFARKQTELRDREARLRLSLDAACRSHDETADIAVKAFELSQNLRTQWVGADYAEKRRLLEIVFLNFRLDDVNLVPTTRKPFDLLAEGLLVSSSRADWIRTSDLLVPNQAL